MTAKYIRRAPIVDNIFKTTGIGHHVDRDANTVASFDTDGGVIFVDCVLLLADEKLVLNDLQKFKIGSLVSYVIESGGDPVAALDRARTLGHSLVSIHALPSVISLHQYVPEPYVRVRHGMVVVFQGVVYRIDPDRNRNLKLTPYTPSVSNLEVV